MSVGGEQGLFIEGLAMLGGHTDRQPGRLPTTALLDLATNTAAPPRPLADCVGV